MCLRDQGQDLSRDLARSGTDWVHVVGVWRHITYLVILPWHRHKCGLQCRAVLTLTPWGLWDWAKGKGNQGWSTGCQESVRWNGGQGWGNTQCQPGRVWKLLEFWPLRSWGAVGCWDPCSMVQCSKEWGRADCSLQKESKHAGCTWERWHSVPMDILPQNWIPESSRLCKHWH